MRQALTLGWLLLLLGCNGPGIEAGEVAATLTGEVIIDNWSKYCSSGGQQISIDNHGYLISHPIPDAFTHSYPLSVWVRYEPAPPDTCAPAVDRVRILTIRKQ
ncbi:hypothetical protein [Spirosoma koreense]